MVRVAKTSRRWKAALPLPSKNFEAKALEIDRTEANFTESMLCLRCVKLSQQLVMECLDSILPGRFGWVAVIIQSWIIEKRLGQGKTEPSSICNRWDFRFFQWTFKLPCRSGRKTITEFTVQMTEITGKIAEIAGHGLDVLNVEIFAVSGASGTLVHAGFLWCGHACSYQLLGFELRHSVWGEGFEGMPCPTHDVVQPPDEEDTLLQQLQEQNTANSL